MDNYSEQQLADLEAREAYEREFGARDEAERIAAMEETGYTDAAEKELAICSGWDPFQGETPSEFLARIGDTVEA
jgi:hypothetical protein